MPSLIKEGIFVYGGEMMRRIIIVSVVLALCWLNPCFALDWIRLHEEADKLTSLKAEEISKAQPNSAEDLYVLGLVYLNEHMDKEAYDIFVRLLTLKPETFEAVWGEAEVLRRQHQLDKAEQMLEEIIKAHKDFSPAYNSLAYVKYLKRDFNASTRLTAQVIERGRKGSDLSNYTWAYLLYGGAKGVIAHFGGPISKIINGSTIFSNLKKAESLQPNSAMVKYGLGSFYLIAPKFVGGNIELAEEYLIKAVELDPKFANSYVRLGEVYKAKGDKAKFETYLIKALKVDPGCELALNVKDGLCNYGCTEDKSD